MNEEEKILKFINEEYGNYDNYVRDLLDLYNKEKERNKDLEQNLRAEREKKDKIINLMAERLEHDTEWFFSEFDDYKKQDFIEYFTNKVEEDK